jgi:hypothetical protein
VTRTGILKIDEKYIEDQRFSASGTASGTITICCKAYTCIKLSVSEAGENPVFDSRVVA